MISDKTREKLLILKKLKDDERSPEGERQAARHFFDKLTKKYGVTEEELEPEPKDTHWFRYSKDNRWEEALLRQIVARTLNSREFKTWRYTKKRDAETGNMVNIGFTLTERQAQRVRVTYDTLRDALERELTRTYKGFVQANDLGLPKTDEEREKEGDLTEEEIEELRRMLRYARLIDPTPVIVDRLEQGRG